MYGHNARQKAKARKSGPSILKKTVELGVVADTLSVTVHWEPTHHEYRIAMHVPEGWPFPDFNGLVSAHTFNLRPAV